MTKRMESRGWAELFSALGRQRFAVIDGAQFDDLPSELTLAGVAARGLYLEGPDRAAVASGPLLVSAETAHAQPVIEALAAARPAVVLWSWPQGEAALYRHLRSLTMFDIPCDPHISGELYESVLFRIADPRVIALVLPLLTPPQLARFMGAAGQIGLIDESGVPRIIRLLDDVEPAKGRIALDAKQYEEVKRRYDKWFRAQLIAEFAPRMQMERLRAEAFVGHAVDRAIAFGMSDIDDRREFVKFYLTVGGRLDNEPGLGSVRAELMDPLHPPELRLFYAQLEFSHLMKRRA